MLNYYTHLDKLTLSFTNADFETATPDFYLKLTNEVPAYAKDYYTNYAIYLTVSLEDRSVMIGYFHKGLKLHPNILILAFNQEILYNPDFQNIFDNLRSTFALSNLKINTYEIAVDTNQPLTLRYEKSYMSGKIKMKSNYKSSYSGNHEDRLINGSKTALKYETKYVRPKTKGAKGRIVKIYHKSSELRVNSYKVPYIISYLESNGLDIKKPIYRMELSGNNNNTFYKAHRSQTIAVDLSRLTDTVYLTSIFNHFSVFDHSQIIDTKTGVPAFMISYVDNIPRIFKEKDDYNQIVENINEEFLKDHYKAILNKYQIKLNELEDENYLGNNSDHILTQQIPFNAKLFDMIN